MAARSDVRNRMTSGLGEIIVWRGNYRFGRNDSFYKHAVKLGKDVDKRPAERPSEEYFREQLEGLRRIAPVNGRGLLDQLEFRWEHPDCKVALYVVTLTLSAPDGGALVGEAGEPMEVLPCIKVGKAMHSVAARISRYITQPLNRVPIARRSQSLRVVIYGDGLAMLSEGDIKEVARASGGSHPKVIDARGREPRRVSPEAYVGTRVVNAIGTFAREQRDGLTTK
jgi:hypothetical protein